MLRFNDGVQFDLSGELRVEWRKDGYYVVGQGMMFAVDSRREGEEEIERMQKKHA